MRIVTLASNGFDTVTGPRGGKVSHYDYFYSLGLVPAAYSLPSIPHQLVFFPDTVLFEEQHTGKIIFASN